MTAVLPVLAAAAVGPSGRLVARRRGRVVHVADADRLTPGGRLPRADRPLCGRRAPSWPVTPVDGRPLCLSCRAALLRSGLDPMAARVVAAVRPDDLAASITTAPDEVTLQATVLAVCRAPGLVRLTPLVRARRDQLALDRRRTAAAAEWALITEQAS